MPKNEVNKTNYARDISDALSVIRSRQNNVPARPPAPEIFDLTCVCAIYDRPYTLRFVRQDSGLLHLTESTRGIPSSPPDNARGGGIGSTLNLDYFENAPTPCAWCGNGGFHHCATYCGTFVCGGRMKGETFHCRKSCGASWVGIPLREVKGVADTTSSLTASSEQRSLSAKPSGSITKPRLLLPAGKPIGQ